MGLYRNAQIGLVVLGVGFIALPSVAQAALNIPLTVTMSEAVTVSTAGGTPRIPVDVGGNTRYATYTSGSGTSALTFTLTPTAGDVDLDGISVSSPVDLNGGTIKDLSGNNTALTFTPPNTSGIKVDYPSLSMDFINSDYILSGTHYASLSSFLSAAGGSFTRSGSATYFDSSGTLQTVGADTPRFDYDPITHAAKGILIEGSSTNNVRNNTMAGAVIGSPGTLPTNWIGVAGFGINVDVVGLGQEDGIDYIDVHFSGTSTGSNTRVMRFDGFSHPATAGSINTLSAFVKLQSGSLSNVSNLLLVMDNADGSGTALNQYATIGIVPTAAALRTQRDTLTSTASSFTNASTAYLRPYIQFTVLGAGLTIDATLRIGLPQIETTPFASSLIKTSGSAATRSMDALWLPVSTWNNAAEGTILLQAHKSPPQSVASRYYGLYQNAGNAQVSLMNDTSPSRVSAYVTDTSAAAVATIPSATLTNDAIFKSGFAYAANDFAHSVGGAAVSTDTSGTFAGLSRLAIGNNVAGGPRPLNGWLRKIAYYPLRITNTQLQLLSQ